MNSREDDGLMHLLHKASQAADALFGQSSNGNSRLTPRQWLVLVNLAKHGSSNQTMLCERTGIDRSTLAEILRRLLVRGLVRRQRSKIDARANVVTLTPAGENSLVAGTAASRQVDAQMLEALPSRERETLLRALRALVSNLSQAKHHE